MEGGLPLTPGQLKVPALSTVTTRLIGQINEESSGTKELANTIKADPSFSARLLRLCNSAAYRRGPAVGDVERALVVLGRENVHRLLLSANLVSVFGTMHTSYFDLPRFWRDSLLRANVALELGRHFDKDLAAQAYLAGLLQDLGVAILAFNSREDYFQAMVQEAEGSAEDLQSLEESLRLLGHVSVIAHLAKTWGFPDDLAKALEWHHQRPDTPAQQDSANRLWCIAYFVGALPMVSVVGTNFRDPGLFNFAWQAFGLDLDALRNLLVRATEGLTEQVEIYGQEVDHADLDESLADAINLLTAQAAMEADAAVDPLG